MSYKPILFSEPLIPALLDDSKTMTRRLVAINMPEVQALLVNIGAGCDVDESTEELIRVHSPWEKGDILWVKEKHWAYGYWEDVKGQFTTTGRQKRRFRVYDRVGFPPPKEWSFDRPNMSEMNHDGTVKWCRRLGRFMPKKYARIFLQVLDVRVERLQQITEADARREGMKPNITAITAARGETEARVAHTVEFIKVIKRLHGDEIWDANPWVYVLSFKRVDKPTDFNE